MAICINCGKESEGCLCNTCKQDVDIEKLCHSIMLYNPEVGSNKLWNSIASELYSMDDFRNIIIALSDELPSPRKEYIRILWLLDNSVRVPKNSRAWLYEIYEKCEEVEGLSKLELNQVQGLVMDAMYRIIYTLRQKKWQLQLCKQRKCINAII